MSPTAPDATPSFELAVAPALDEAGTHYGLIAARWDRFGRPDPLPKYGAASFPAVWWWDAKRAGKTGIPVADR